METLSFGLCYLGGRVDLLKLRDRIKKYYPEIDFILLRDYRILKVLLKRGELSEVGDSALHLYLFEDGMGLTALASKPEEQKGELFEDPSGFLFNNPILSETISLFFKRTQGGIEFTHIGKGEINRGIGPGSGFLIINKAMGKEVIQNSIRMAPDVYAELGNRFFTPKFSSELLSDLILFFHREFAIARYRGILSDWTKNLKILIKEEGNLKTPEMNFRLYLSELLGFLLKNERINYKILDSKRMEDISKYKKERALILAVIEGIKDVLKSPLSSELRREIEEIKTHSTLISLLISIGFALLILSLPRGPLLGRALIAIALIAGTSLYFISQKYRRYTQSRKAKDEEIEKEETKIAELKRKIEEIKELEDIPDEVKNSYLAELGEKLGKNRWGLW